MRYNTTPCPGCGLPVVILTHRLNPSKGKYRSNRGARTVRAREETVMRPKDGGDYKIDIAGVPHKVRKGNGEYVLHTCRAKPQLPGGRPTMGFRLD